MTDQQWFPRPKPAAPRQEIRVQRDDDHPVLGRRPRHEGARIVAEQGDAVLVHWQHRAPTAHAVAVQINGWWYPVPHDGLDLVPEGDGWFSGALWVPSELCATAAFVEHRVPGPPPWWTRGLKGLSTCCGHIVDASARRIRSRQRSATSVLHEIRLTKDSPRARWCAVGLQPDEGRPEASHMPLVVLTDAQAHLDVLDTPGLLATATREGRLPPVIAVFIDAWPNRAEQLGVPGGQAAWIVEKLLPTLHRQGLTDPTTGEYWRIDPDPRRTILTGASFGGLTALFAFAEAPELCSSVSAQSVSLWGYQTGAFTEFLAAAASRVGVHNARVRLHAGRYEGDMASDAAILTRALHDVANWTVLLVIHEGGHDWAWWQQAMLDDVTGFLNGKAYGDLDG